MQASAVSLGCEPLPVSAEPSLDAVRERWILRYGLAGSPVAAWQASEECNAPAVAFTALVQDPGLLSRLSTGLGKRLARDARAFATTIAQQASDPKVPAARLSQFVLDQVRGWERRRRSDPSQYMEGLAVEPGMPDDEDALAAICRQALRHYPQFNERIGRLATVVLDLLGAEGLAGLKPSWARMLAFEAACYAARGWRGALKQPGVPTAQLLNAVQAAQRWASGNGMDLMRVPYTGTVGTPAIQAVMLSRDAGTIARLALELPGGGSAPGVTMWVDAEEMHGFAALALDRSVITLLDLTEAERIASCAVCYATRASNEGASVVAPAFTGGQAQDISFGSIIAVAKRALPNGARDRLIRLPPAL